MPSDAWGRSLRYFFFFHIKTLKNASYCGVLSITSSNRKMFLSLVARRVVCKQTKSAGEGWHCWLSGRAGVVESSLMMLFTGDIWLAIEHTYNNTRIVILFSNQMGFEFVEAFSTWRKKLPSYSFTIFPIIYLFTFNYRPLSELDINKHIFTITIGNTI